MNRNELLKQIRSALEEVPNLRELKHDDPKRGKWETEVANTLEKFLGKDSNELKSFNKCKLPHKYSKEEGLKERFNCELRCEEAVLREIVKEEEVKQL